jgi:hypothetical protein
MLALTEQQARRAQRKQTGTPRHPHTGVVS